MSGRAMYLGGYLLPVRDGGKAGPHGCDKCADCGNRPAPGEPVFWLSSLLICGPCVDRKAVPHA